MCRPIYRYTVLEPRVLVNIPAFSYAILVYFSLTQLIHIIIVNNDHDAADSAAADDDFCVIDADNEFTCSRSLTVRRASKRICFG